MADGKRTRIYVTLALLTLLLALPAALAAQCSMCRENAAATGERGRALNLGILVLLVPTLGMFVSVFVFALRRRDALLSQDTPAEPKDTRRSLWFTWSANRR